MPRNPTQQAQLILELVPNQSRHFAQSQPSNLNQFQFQNPNKQVIKSQAAKLPVQSLMTVVRSVQATGPGSLSK